MKNKSNIEIFKKLIKSKDPFEIKQALVIAQENGVDINEHTIDNLYTRLRGSRPKYLPDVPLTQKLKVINSYTKIHIHLDNKIFDLSQFLYFNTIKEVKISFQCNAFQYIQIFLKQLFKHQKLEVLEMRRYPLPFLPKEIENLKNLRVLKCTSSRIESLPDWSSNLNHLQELNLYNSNITSITKSLERLPMLKKLNLSNTPLISQYDDIKQKIPHCEIII